jgi:Domain of unknown function (DU1801)
VRSIENTVTGYLKSLSPERRRVISAVRRVIRKHLPKGYQETMNWGMICYEIPMKRYPNTYNGQPLGCAALASQKNYCSLYLSCVYQDSSALKKLKAAFANAGLKLNMGKCCVRFHKPTDLPLETIGELISQTTPDDLIRIYESIGPGRKKYS